MKKAKILSIMIIALCLILSLGGNAKAVAIDYVTEGQSLVNYPYKDLIPNITNHVITLESNNTGNRFKFYSKTNDGVLKKINNSTAANNGVYYDYVILPGNYNAMAENDNTRDAYGNTQFNTGDSFKIRYHNIATYRGQGVDCVVTINPRNPGADSVIDNWITDYEGINYTNYGAIGFYANFYQGFTYFNTSGCTISYNLVYANTNNNLGLTNMYWSWGSVNKPEGIASTDTVNKYFLVNSSSYAHTTFTNFSNDIPGGISKAQQAYVKNYGGADGTYWGVGLDAQNCSDKWAVGDFDRTFVGFNVTSASGVYTFKTLSHDFWFCPFFYPIGATAPVPVKSVKTTSESAWHNSIEVFVGDPIQFKVDQKVEDRRQGGTGYMKYSSFKYEDKLPNEVEYKSAKVYKNGTEDVTNRGTLRYNNSTHTVTFEFYQSYLSDGMAYNGETYNLVIDCVVDSDSVEGRAFDNTPKTIINNTELTNTKVTVTPHYKEAKIIIEKEDLETGKTTQGDAKFEGAVYGIYKDAACREQYQTVTLDANGHGESNVYHVVDYRNGNYTYREDFYIKEITAPEGYLIDTQVYHIKIDRNAITNPTQTLKVETQTSKEQVIKNDIKIYKFIEETTSTPKQALPGVTFTATLDSDTSKVYTATTDNDGYCIFENLPYGTYTITETAEPDIAYDNLFTVGTSASRVTTISHKIEVDKNTNTIYSYDDVTNIAKKMNITVYKEDEETGIETQGDAKLSGAVYGVYTDEQCTQLVKNITTRDNEDGTHTATIENLLVGTYYIKEVTPPEGYLIDENVYKVEQIPSEQTVEITKHSITSKDRVMKGSISVVKELDVDDNSENDPAEGCKLYLTLASKGAPVYEGIIDQYGRAEFEEIPYGTYTITESEEARTAGYKLIKPETGITINKNNQKLIRIFEEPPIESYIQVTKVDAETGNTIPVANTKYKIWSYKENKYLELHSYPSGVISEFLTDANGMFTTPEPLRIGRYRLDEMTPPNGYHREDMDFVVEDGVYEYDHEELIIPVSQSDIAQKGRIQITKKAEVLVGAKQETDPDTGLEVYVPQYETRGLAGVTYKITAKQNITTADGKVRMAQGQSVYVTTGEDGVATSDYLYLGEYEVTEANAPDGYALNTKAETVVLDYRTNGTDNEGKLVVLDDYTVALNFENERIPYELSFDKTFGETEYNNVTEETKNSVKFGLYAAEDIKIYNSQVAAIAKDKLVEIIPVVNGKCTATADLPVGSYYIKELDLDIPFRIDPTEYPFEFKPNCNTQKVTVNIPTINNDIDTGLMNFLKVSRKVYNKNKALIDEIIANNDIDAFNEFAQENGLAGAKYQVFFKVNGEYTPLQVKNIDGEYEDIFFTTGEMGIDSTTLPVGTYYVKELEAPVDHELDPNYHAINVLTDGTNLAIVEDPKIQGKITVIHKDVETGEIIYDIEDYEDDIGEEYHTVDREQEINDRYTPDFKIYELVEEKIPENKDGEFKVEEQTVIYYYVRLKGHLTVIKKDAETGDRLKGCKFTIKDLITGQTLVENAVTDENGEWSMEDVPYGRYVFTEVEAPEGYVLEEGSIGAVFDVKTEETVFEIVNTGDIQVIALTIVAIVSTFGIVYISKRKFAKNK